MKKCKKCGIEKEASEFYKENRTKDGLRPNCKVCYEKARVGYQKEYRKTETSLAIYRKHRALYAKNPENREKIRARDTLNNAIKAGRLSKKPCIICGDEKVHGHHYDYSKPLDVKWLCRKHHIEEHKSM